MPNEISTICHTSAIQPAVTFRVRRKTQLSLLQIYSGTAVFFAKLLADLSGTDDTDSHDLLTMLANGDPTAAFQDAITEFLQAIAAACKTSPVLNQLVLVGMSRILTSVCIENITGLEVDGQPVTPEVICDFAPVGLCGEILTEIEAEYRLAEIPEAGLQTSPSHLGGGQ